MTADPWLVGGPWAAIAGESRAVLEAAVEAMRRPGLVVIPRLTWIDGAVVARWVYRRWLAAGGQGPLRIVDVAHLGGAPEARLRHELGRAAVYVAGPPSGVPSGAVPEAGRLLVSGGGPFEVPVGLVAAIEQLDALHATAVDPTLEGARRILMSWCAAAGVVRVVGPKGSGRRSLARWAWLAHGGGATCSVVPSSFPGEGSPGWTIYEDIEELEAPLRADLDRELSRRDAALRGPPNRPPGPRVARPDHPALAAQVGHSRPLVQLLEQTLAAAAVPPGDERVATVHITGPTGSGKELVARALHELSRRRGPLVAKDLRTTAAGLMTAELYGSVKGAFPDATDRPGVFEQADGGTLFLDEIANIPIEVQQELLRVLETRTVRRLGTHRDLTVDVRIVTATSRDLDLLVSRGEFIADLLFRLRRRTLRVPALRDRVEDIPELVQQLLAARGRRIDDEALLVLMRHPWPGNVRELQSALDQAALQATDVVRRDHLAVGAPPHPLLLVSQPETPLPALALSTVSLPPATARPEALAAAIHDALAPRPIDPDALALLLSCSWPEGLRSVRGTLATLAASPPGPITREAVRRELGAAGVADAREPIVVVQSPSLDLGGNLVAMHHAVGADALLVGRGLGEMLASWDAGGGAPVRTPIDQRCVDRLRWLRGRLGDHPPAPVSLNAYRSLARGQFLVERHQGGLRVTRLPDTSAGVHVTSVEDDLCFDLGEGAVAITGRIARVEVRRGRALVVELWFCNGYGAFAELRDWLLPAGGERTEQPTIHGPQVRVEVRPEAVWRVSDAERDALVGVAVHFVESGSRSFGRTIAERLPALRVGAGRVAAFLDREDVGFRLKCYVRLVDHPPNAAVQDALADALARFRPEHLAGLPDGLARALRARGVLVESA